MSGGDCLWGKLCEGKMRVGETVFRETFYREKTVCGENFVYQRLLIGKTVCREKTV